MAGRPTSDSNVKDLLHSSRTRFMIETLTNLRNNKVKRVAGQDGHSESTERMKKFLSGLTKKHHSMFCAYLKL